MSKDKQTTTQPQKIIKRWGIGFVLLLALALLAYFLKTELEMTGGELGVPLDDAWIHYQFARNLSEGLGFSYIPGVPTPGSTSPLWTMLIAGLSLFTSQIMPASLLLSAGFFILTIWLTYKLGAELLGSQIGGILAALGVVFTGRLLWAGLSAMEVTLFTSISLAAVWSYHRYGMRAGAALLFGLATLARPEGHVLFGLVLADSCLTFIFPSSSQSTKQVVTWWHLLTAVLIYGLISLPYTLFSLSVTGRPLPNTYYAKSRSETIYSLRTLKETLFLHWRDNFLALLLTPFGLLFLRQRNRLLGAWVWGLIFLLPAIVPLVWHHGRYSMPLIPFLLILAVAGIFWFKQHLPAKIAGIVIPIMTVILIAAGAWSVPHWATMLGNNSREIQEIDVALGQWLAENIPSDSVVAVDDIGAIEYLSPRPIVDLNGLVSPEMWPLLADADFNTAAIHLLAKADVEYLAIFPGWHGPLIANSQWVQPVQRFQTSTHTIIGEQEAIVYKVDWPYRQEIAPQKEQEVMLGGIIKLRGFDFGPPNAGTSTTEAASVLSTGISLSLTLYWESLQATPISYKVFVHLIDETGAVSAQIDRPPGDNMTPTHRWQSGDLVRDVYEMQMPADLPAGHYQIWVGMYTDEGGRLPATGRQLRDNSIWLTDWELAE